MLCLVIVEHVDCGGSKVHERSAMMCTYASKNE